MKFSPPLCPREVELALKPRFSSVTAIADGTGGQGVVFRATVNGAGEKESVALKIYFPGATTERTHREVQSLSRMKVDSLVSIHSSGKIRIREEECIFLATRYIEGDLLSNRIRNSPQTVQVCSKIAHDIAIAIEVMWRERIVHRDIKPSNIILTPKGSAVLFDLGVARHISMESLTTVGKTWGTQGYMSPEQARAMRQLSCKADLFSLGVVLQECLLGRHPVANNQMLLLNGGPPTSSLRSNLPKDFVEGIDALLFREAHRRLSPNQVVECFAKWL